MTSFHRRFHILFDYAMCLSSTFPIRLLRRVVCLVVLKCQRTPSRRLFTGPISRRFRVQRFWGIQFVLCHDLLITLSHGFWNVADDSFPLPNLLAISREAVRFVAHKIVHSAFWGRSFVLAFYKVIVLFNAVVRRCLCLLGVTWLWHS